MVGDILLCCRWDADDGEGTLLPSTAGELCFLHCGGFVLPFLARNCSAVDNGGIVDMGDGLH